MKIEVMDGVTINADLMEEATFSNGAASVSGALIPDMINEQVNTILNRLKPFVSTMPTKLLFREEKLEKGQIV